MFLNLSLVRALKECCNFKNLPLAIISLDQEKAFDRVNCNFLDRVLHRMNFGSEFRQWIRVICTNISSACLHSGFLTSFFEISCGARQGGPFPPCYIPGISEKGSGSKLNLDKTEGMWLALWLAGLMAQLA